MYRYLDKEDLISANLATTHFPGLVDWWPFATFRGRWYHDGSFGGSGSTLARRLEAANDSTIVVNYEDDPNLQQPSFVQLGKLTTLEGARELFRWGQEHGKRLVAERSRALGDADQGSPQISAGAEQRLSTPLSHL